MEVELTSDSLSSEELFADDEALEAKDEDEEQDDMSSSLSVRELFRLRLVTNQFNIFVIQEVEM